MDVLYSKEQNVGCSINFFSTGRLHHNHNVYNNCDFKKVTWKVQRSYRLLCLKQDIRRKKIKLNCPGILQEVRNFKC